MRRSAEARRSRASRSAIPQRLPVPNMPRMTPFRMVCVDFDPEDLLERRLLRAARRARRSRGLLQQAVVLGLRLLVGSGLCLVDRGLLLGVLGIRLRLRQRGLLGRGGFVRRVHAGGEDLAGRFAVDRRSVLRQQRGCRHRGVDRGVGRRRHEPLGRAQAGPGDRRRRALLAHDRDDRLAGAELLQDALEVVARLRVRADGRPERLRIVGREGAQRVLDARAELGEHVGGNVLRGLRDEEDADALRADQAHGLHDRREEVLRGVLEQQVRLVEEEHELRLVEIADLGQDLEQLREQVHQERGEQRRLVGDAGHLEQADDAAAVRRDAQEIVHVELGLAEEDVCAVVGEGDQLAEDDPSGRGRQTAQFLELGLALVAGEVAEHGAEVRQVDQRETVRVGIVEHQPEAGLLRLVQAEHLAEQQRTEARNGGADRNAFADAAEGEVLGDGCLGLPVLADRAGCARAASRSTPPASRRRTGRP